MRARAAAGLAAAILATPGLPAADAADEFAPPPDAVQGVDEAGARPAPAPAPAPAPPAGGSAPAFPLIRPILLVGVGGGLGDSNLWLGADLGLRVESFTARGAFRVLSLGDDYAEYWSGRLGWIVLEREWLALHGGIGGGQVTRRFSGAGPSTSASGAAASLEFDVLFGQRWIAGPMVSISLEAIAPAGAGGPLAGPTVAVYGSVNLLVALQVAAHLH
jgi:hypothetical protein